MEDVFSGNALRGFKNASSFIKDLARVPTAFKDDIWGCKRFKWQVNNGVSVRFWVDWWTGSDPLCNSFAHLFEISRLKYALVRDMVHAWVGQDNGSPWIRNLSGYESLECAFIGSLISSLKFLEKNDSVIWMDNVKFSTSYCQNLLWPWNIIWKVKIPPRVKFFLWQCSHSVLPTFSFLNSRGIDMNTVCIRCRSGVESQDHILWKCPLDKEIWRLLGYWLDVNLSNPPSPVY